MAQRWGQVSHFMVSPWRHSKTGIFWFRQAVPKAMQAAVAEVLGRPGKRHLELKWTLGTRDLAEAKRLWPAALKKAQGIFEAAHKGAEPLSPEQLHALSGLFYGRQLALWKRDAAPGRRGPGSTGRSRPSSLTCSGSRWENGTWLKMCDVRVPPRPSRTR
ncbi:DUF6538 domain-containing protein [Rhizosaccharibacter radicis]|uniref:DUF6538 domain-containing protein n=1 Tax=Rhizosaccharibacter radicis TaxID=2782605 RepID=UPI003BF535C6